MKKYFFIKLLVVCIFIIVAYMICDLTKYYIRPINYRDDENRVIINSTEVTRNLPDEALFVNEKIMLSFDTIQKYFDEYIYFDEKYETVIITNDVDVVKLKLNENEININGETKQIPVSASEVSGEIYIPIEELQDIYDIEVENNEKIIISTSDANYSKVEVTKKGKAKLYKRETSLTTGIFKKNEILTVFSGDDDSEYIRVRTANGDLGYIKKEKIEGNVIYKNEIKEVKNVNSKKINLTWEYAENYTPNRSSESKIEGLDIISPTWIYVKNTSGDIKTNTISTEYINWAKKQGYELWPILKNDGLKTKVSEGKDESLEGTSALITDMNARETLINNVVEVALQYDFEGINLDFEYMKMEDKDEFSQFVREFSATLRRNGIIASVDVNVPDGSATWSLCYDHKPIADACDYMILMAYDQYGTKQEGPVASITWVENNINKLLDREKVDNSKLILGVPFYSKYRKNRITMSGDEEIQKNITSSTLYMQGAQNYLNNAKYKNSATWVDSLGQYYIEYRNQDVIEKIWIEDENALKEKVKLVNEYNLAGVASWRWGFETEEAWDVINSTLNNN